MSAQMEKTMTVTAIANIRTRQEWAEIINADWRKSIEGIIQTGSDLIAAKGELPYGEFGKMIKADCPFGVTAARTMMTIARNYDTWIAVMKDRRHDGALPSSWTTLGKLSSISEDDFKDAHEQGLITADMSREKANAIARAYKTPIDGVVGSENDPSTLPAPKEAREIARATNRMVAARDGRIYSGATEEEGADHVRKRDQTYMIIDTINAIVENNVSPKQWVQEAKDHWLHRFEFGRVDVATRWLAELGAELVRQRRLFDIEGEADGE